MKYNILIILLIISNALSYSQMILWKGDKPIFKTDTEEVDSITFCEKEQQNFDFFSVKGVFSVSTDKKIQFSKGNLIFNKKTKKWSFANNQWDFIGELNEHIIDSTYFGDIDLFCFSTNKNNDYGITVSNNPSLFWGEFIDWGELINKESDDYHTNIDTIFEQKNLPLSEIEIINKTLSIDCSRKNITGFCDTITNYDFIIETKKYKTEWFTLSYDEWAYLRYYRDNAKNLYSQATVNNVHGIIFLPDNFSNPGVSFTPEANSWETNIYNTKDWKKLEDEGAVFLPASGWRTKTKTEGVNSTGTYWSSSTFTPGISSSHAGTISFGENSCGFAYQEKYFAISVRLVHIAN